MQRMFRDTRACRFGVGLLLVGFMWVGLVQGGPFPAGKGAMPAMCGSANDSHGTALCSQGCFMVPPAQVFLPFPQVSTHVACAVLGQPPTGHPLPLDRPPRSAA
jgi:hypothetical protein